jgi:hypothetical protein
MVGFEPAVVEAGGQSTGLEYSEVCEAWPNHTLHLTGAAFSALRGIASLSGPGR